MSKELAAMVGMKYRGAVDFVNRLPAGEPLILVRDANNIHDFDAVQVWHEQRHVAFVAAAEVKDIARYMDAKHLDTMPCKLVFIARYPNIEVEMP